MLFGKYCLLERVSVGGMAEIFRAKPFNTPESQKHLALKRILPHLAEDDEFVQMFIDEAKLTVQLVHPNIVRTYELGRFHTSPYILMEFISGQDILELQRQLRNERRIMSVAMACYVAAEIATGLEYVHESTDAQGNPLNIIHRDISPQNVLVTYGGKVKIIDFGIAKAAIQQTKTQVGVLKGKFGYMSPEQVRGQTIDHRSDIFTVGILLWEMLTNRRLFRGESEFETLQLVREPDIELPSNMNAQVPREVDRIVLKALATERDERYQSGGELARDISAFLESIEPAYGAENLSDWMAEMFSEELDAERQKRQLFAKIQTRADVRGIAGGVGGEDTQPDELLDDAETDDLWAADIAPANDVDASQFASEHTVVAAGGFDANQFAAEQEEDVIALDLDDIIELDDAALDAPSNFGAESAQRDTLERTPPSTSLEFPTHGTPQNIPNPSVMRRRRKKKIRAAAAALGVLCLAAGLTVYLWVERNSAASEPAHTQVSAKQSATLVISVSPPVGLSVQVDGVERGSSAPVTVADLEPGTHTITVSHPSFETHEEQIELGSGGFKSLNVELKSAARGQR